MKKKRMVWESLKMKRANLKMKTNEWHDGATIRMEDENTLSYMNVEIKYKKLSETSNHQCQHINTEHSAHDVCA